MLSSVLKWEGHALLNSNKNKKIYEWSKACYTYYWEKMQYEPKYRAKLDLNKPWLQKGRRMGMKKKHGQKKKFFCWFEKCCHMEVIMGNIGHIQPWALSVKSCKEGKVRTLKQR